MKFVKGLLLVASSLMTWLPASASIWQKMESSEAPVPTVRTVMPQKYLLYATSESSLKSMLSAASSSPEQAAVVSLPMPDGSMMDFRVWKNDMMAADLAARYTEIQTFTGVAVKDSRITAKLDYTVRGFHAMIFGIGNTIFIDPYTNIPTDYYLSYYRNDYERPASQLMPCAFNDHATEDIATAGHTEGAGLKTANGNNLRKYRLALACTGEYSVAVGGSSPTKATVLSAMVTSINRVNGVYERELAVTLQLISNTDQLIYLTGSTDPYSNDSGDVMLNQNQSNVTSVIGSANYDIGHVFSTGGGGIAILSSVCRSGNKAMGVTGSPSPVGDAYDIDYVAHEMGHQFGSDHTFNNNANGSCYQNAATTLAYEPGSGSTIMAYAGICSPDNLQTHSDAYFHAKSIANIVANITSSGVATCPTVTTSGNKSLYIAPFTQSYSIPYKTPFEITAPEAVDSVGGNQHTYCWEQWNLGDFGARFANTYLKGPITRSFSPDTSRTRIFPALAKLLVNTTSYTGEKLPDTARFLTYKLTARSFYNGVGSVNILDDTIHLDVINTGTPFVIIAPSATGITWGANTTQTVTWNVANTTAAPINCANVNVYLSVDGGYTYPYTLATGVANSGSATVTIPNVNTTKARIKVKGAGNVFFDISNFNFTISGGTGVATISSDDLVKIFPVPATDQLNITANTASKLQATLTDQTGRIIWNGVVTNSASISVSHLSRGIYYFRAVDASNGAQLTRKVVLQ